MTGFDPIERAKAIAPRVARGDVRQYARLRAARFYGGIATADCAGCNLDCVFCWSRHPRDRPAPGGRFLSPEEVLAGLSRIARERGFRLLRASGNEPTLARVHLLALLDLVERSPYEFVLETNGTLIDPSYAEDLARFRRVHVRVSLKRACESEFAALTGTAPEGFRLALEGIRHLVEAGASVHAAAMLSFSEPAAIQSLRDRLRAISPALAADIEEEHVILYPHVAARIRGRGISPRIALDPQGRPCAPPPDR